MYYCYYFFSKGGGKVIILFWKLSHLGRNSSKEDGAMGEGGRGGRGRIIILFFNAWGERRGGHDIVRVRTRLSQARRDQHELQVWKPAWAGWRGGRGEGMYYCYYFFFQRVEGRWLSCFGSYRILEGIRARKTGQWARGAGEGRGRIIIIFFQCRGGGPARAWYCSGAH